MHAVGLHSALAIRRERRRRDEQRRARERRYSLQSSESGLTSPHCSTGSLRRRKRPTHDNEVVSSVGMLHLGVVFLVLGLFLLGSGLLPDNLTSWSVVGSGGWLNELVCTGIFALCLGLFLVLLNRYISKNEEEALEDYVSRQLTRSRSGHRLERDAETGGMLTKQVRRARDLPPAPVSPAPVAHPVPRDPPALEQIAEEECSAASSEPPRRLDTFNRDTYSNLSTALSLSPTSPSDTKELIGNGRYIVMPQM